MPTTATGKSRSRPASQNIEDPVFTPAPPPHFPTSPQQPSSTSFVPAAPAPFTPSDLREILADNRDAMAQMLQSFLTVNAATAARAPVHSAPVPRPLKLNLKNPEEFDGRSRNVVNFLSEVNAHIIADPVSFDLDQTKIMFFLSFCSKGSARTWKNKVLSDIQNGMSIYPCETYAEFLADFKRVFYDPHSEEQAQRELMSMRQGNLSAVDFLIAFEEAKDRSGFCDKSAIFHLKRALNVRLLSEISRTSGDISSFAEWKAAAVDCDHRLQEIDATISHQRSDLRLGQPATRSSRWFPFKPTSSPATQAAAAPSLSPAPANPVPTGPAPAPRASLPANISAPPDKFLRPRPHFASGCFNCGAKDHIAQSCNLPFNREFRRASRSALERARAVMEEFEALPEEDREEIFRVDCDDVDATAVDEGFVEPTE